MWNFRTGRKTVLAYEGARGDVQWSPDSTRFMLTVSPKGAAISSVIAVVIDATTGHAQPHTLQPTPHCMWCAITWSRDGSSLLVADGIRRLREDAADRTSGLDVYTTDGKATAVLPIPGYPVNHLAWSPDGRHVVVTGTELIDGQWREVPQLIDVATGKVICDLPSADVAWLNDTHFLSAEWEPHAIVLRGTTGVATDHWTLPADLVDVPLHAGA